MGMTGRSASFGRGRVFAPAARVGEGRPGKAGAAMGTSHYGDHRPML